MDNIKLTLSFDGTRYSGWQRQINGCTVQEVLEDQLASIYKQAIRVVPCGRTDAGVHAKMFVVNFKMPPSSLPISNIPDALNSGLPEDICVYKAKKVSSDFHARFSVKQKVYRYTIRNAPYRSVFDRCYYHQDYTPLDIDFLNKAAVLFHGEHDFTSFCSESFRHTHCVRVVDRLYFQRKGYYIYMTIIGKGFLYNMVRIIVGTLLEVAKHKRKMTDINAIFKKKDRCYAGPTAPAKGLTLWKVVY